MKVIYTNHAAGDQIVRLEQDHRGRWLLTTNAETRKRVHPEQFRGWPEQKDPRATKAWIENLVAQFGGNRPIALGFARRAGAIGVPRA